MTILLFYYVILYYNSPSDSGQREETVLDMLSPEKRLIERTVFTKSNNKFEIKRSEIPPIISPSIRGTMLSDTEMEKQSVYVKQNTQLPVRNICCCINYSNKDDLKCVFVYELNA